MKYMTVLALFYPKFLVASSSSPSAPAPNDWKPVIDAVTAIFSTSNIVAVLASVVAGGIIFVFLWWGVRLAFRSVMGCCGCDKETNYRQIIKK